MKKKQAILGALLTLALTSGVVLASPADNPNDSAYVKITSVADTAKAKGETPSLAELKEAAPAKVSLVDKQATPETVALFKYLSALPKTGHIIYGHQNDAHHKMFRTDGDGTESDTKDAVGCYAGMVGMDALSFTGSELRLTDAEVNTGATYLSRSVEISKKAAEEGAVITLSAHMPNFAQVAKLAEVKGYNDFGGYSPNDFRGKVMTNILPGGSLNGIYNEYLDMIAEYALALQADHIPVIFRPFHEHNGSWFWWGQAFCKGEEYTAAWKYTVEYLRDQKGVHNFLYAYSPNGPFSVEKAYLNRYPGDDYVDILGLDSYDDHQDQKWLDDLSTTLGIMEQLGEQRGKVVALTECGVRTGGSMPVSGNVNKKWFSDVSRIAREHHVSYFLTWANFEKCEHNFFQPYTVSETRGHEMINEFIDFYNEPSSLFADGVGDYRALK